MKPHIVRRRSFLDAICGSIHPQGWVPIETRTRRSHAERRSHGQGVAFTPKGGCPLKQEVGFGVVEIGLEVAFTPKGGC